MKRVIPKEINDKKAYSIGDDSLVLICPDYEKDGITLEDIKEMHKLIPAKITSSSKPSKIVPYCQMLTTISKD